MDPKKFKPVTWRNTTRVWDDAKRNMKTMGVCFNDEDGNAIRFQLDIHNARNLSKSIAQCLDYHESCQKRGIKQW